MSTRSPTSKAQAIIGTFSLIVTGCDNYEREAELQNNVAAFVDACSGTMFSELTLNAHSSALSLSLSCDDADKEHTYFRTLTQEDIQSLRDSP